MTTDTKDIALPPKTGAMAAGGEIKAIVPQSLDDTFRLANLIAKSGLAPGQLDSAEKVMIALLHGLEVGLPPMMAMQSIAVINGRPTIWGDGALGLVRSTGLLEEFTETLDGAGDNMIARCTMKRKGEKAIIHEFAVADAKKAGLWTKKGPWQDYPRRMLAVRPRSWCLRDCFADVLKGLRPTEEVMDYDEPKNITPPAEVISPPAAPPPADEPPQAEAPPAIIDNETATTEQDKVSDWEQRLASADRKIQDEIFEFEIDPFRESGALSASAYNHLLNLVKEPA